MFVEANNTLVNADTIGTLYLTRTADSTSVFSSCELARPNQSSVLLYTGKEEDAVNVLSTLIRQLNQQYLQSTRQIFIALKDDDGEFVLNLKRLSAAKLMPYDSGHKQLLIWSDRRQRIVIKRDPCEAFNALKSSICYNDLLIQMPTPTMLPTTGNGTKQ